MWRSQGGGRGREGRSVSALGSCVSELLPQMCLTHTRLPELAYKSCLASAGPELDSLFSNSTYMS